MPVERGRDLNADGVLPRKGLDKPRKIALQMDAEREEVGEDQNFTGPAADKGRNGIAQARLDFEERGLIKTPSALARRRTGDRSHRLVRRFYR